LWSSGAASTVTTGSANTTPANGRTGPTDSRRKRCRAANRQVCITVSAISITSIVKAYSSVRFQVYPASLPATQSAIPTGP
jgi:hypothetical protein